MITEIRAQALDAGRFIAEKIDEIRAAVGDGTAISALSGGVDHVDRHAEPAEEVGQQIEVRCWDSVDARVATPTRLPFEMLEQLAAEIIRQVPGVVSVTYNITPKPPSTIEAV